MRREREESSRGDDAQEDSKKRRTQEPSPERIALLDGCDVDVLQFNEVPVAPTTAHARAQAHTDQARELQLRTAMEQERARSDQFTRQLEALLNASLPEDDYAYLMVGDVLFDDTF